jgi:signal transduction histidine kinase
VLDGSLGDVSEEKRGFLEVEQRNTQQLARLVLDLLDRARVEASRFPLQGCLVDVATMLDAVVEILDPCAVA